MGISVEPPGPVDSLAPAGSVINFGSVTAPGAAGLITAVTPTVAGTYQVRIIFNLQGTPSAADINNIKLVVNGSTKSTLVLSPAVTSNGADLDITLNIAWTAGSIAVEAVAAGTAGAIYSCNMIVTQVG
jgi:hypothetical protein